MFDDFNDFNFDDDEDELDTSYTMFLGFAEVNDLIKFIEWVNNTFEDPYDLEEWFNNRLREYSGHSCTQIIAENTPEFVCESCDATFSTSTGLMLHQKNKHRDLLQSDPFWSIINNSYLNHQSGVSDDDISGSA